jgi:hypothetical protein
VILLLCVIVYAIIGQRLFAPLVPDKFGTFALSLYTVSSLPEKSGALYRIREKNSIASSIVSTLYSSL